jgi:ParB/RepB/Spo0J family partition protein
MADDDSNLNAAAAVIDTDAPGAEAPISLIGRNVRIKADAKDMGTDNLHMCAGMYGTVAKLTPFGAFMVTVGRKTKQFDRDDFDLVPDAGETHTEVQPAAGAIIHTTLVEAPPAHAINSPTNPRKRRGLDIDSLTQLAASLRAHGFVQPITVRPLPAHRLEETAHMNPRPAYEVVAGERRWRASVLGELQVMPMLVRELTDEAVLELQLVENIEREDLDAMEEAEGFALLRDKLGYTVDQIAERIGKGKGASYVRKTMKLLELTPESREAMYDGHLGRSTGLLVARYPAERQAAVVAYIKSQAITGVNGIEPAPFRGLAPALHARFNTDLAKAAFDINDPVLVMEAGACTSCPKRTGQAQDLFGEADRATPSSCTDESCFASKKVAHIQRIHVQAKADGMEVIDGDLALKLLPSPFGSYVSGYTLLTDVVDTIEVDGGEDREVTLEDALRKMGRKAPKPMVLVNPHTGAAIKLLPDEVANKFMPEPEPNPLVARKGGSSQQGGHVDTSPPEEVAWRDSQVRRAALIRTFDVIRNRERTIEEMRLIARALLNEEQPAVEEYLGWSTWLEELDHQEEIYAFHREKIEAMNADEVGQLIAMCAMEIATTTWIFPEKPHDLLSAYGIDLVAVQDKVAEDLARQQEAEASDQTEEDPA